MIISCTLAPPLLKLFELELIAHAKTASMSADELELEGGNFCAFFVHDYDGWRLGGSISDVQRTTWSNSVRPQSAATN